MPPPGHWHYNQITPAQHTKQGKMERKIMITLQIIRIPTNNKNIQFDQSIQTPISSTQLQHTHTFTSTSIHVSEVHCGSAYEPGGSGVPYYCTPPVCVPSPDVIQSWCTSCVAATKKKVSVKKMGEGWTGGASDIVKAESHGSGEDPRATGGLVSNPPHPRVKKTKQHKPYFSPSSARVNHPSVGSPLLIHHLSLNQLEHSRGVWGPVRKPEM